MKKIVTTFLATSLLLSPIFTFNQANAKESELNSTHQKVILNKSVSNNVYSPVVEDVYAPVSNDVYLDSNDQFNTNLETFNVDQLDQYPDVKKFIYDNGYEDKLKKPNETSNEIIQEFNLESHTLGISAETEKEVGTEDAKRIMKAYGIEQPKNVVQNFEQFVIVERNAINAQAKSVSNVWYINYITTNAGFTVNVTNVGNDPLDSVSGVLRKFDLSARTFTQVSSVKFSKASVNSGLIYTWSQPRTKVSDFFQYEITVKEDSTVQSYNNKSETLYNHKYQRYLFQTGPYNTLTALGGERHHFVSTKALTSNGYSYTTAPAIRMTQADHYKTGSRGGGTTATAFRNQEIALLKAKKYQDLMQLEVNDFQASSDPDGKYSSLADKYLDQVVATLERCEKYFGFVSQ